MNRVPFLYRKLLRYSVYKGGKMEFKRFVSYLYDYHDNRKNQNCGFVKVEVRQNMTRFILHMYLPQRRDVDYKLYGFIRKNGILEGTLLGIGKVKNGNLDIRIQMPSVEPGIKQGTPSVDQLSGMLVKGSDKTWYGTVWDDGEIDIHTFQEKKIEENLENTEERKTEPIKMQPTEPMEMAQDQKVDSEIEKIKTDEMQIKKNESDLKQKENTEDEIHIQEYKEEIEWELLRKVCATIVPFEGAKMGEYIRMEPKELKYLPQQNWYLGRNSFLLHGYYNYRYLILGQNKEGTLLGVPGIYSPMEENVAAMFGFPRFIPAQKGNKQKGQFGYWCKRI